MPTNCVVLLQSDSKLTESLSTALADSLTSIHLAGNAEELSAGIAKRRAQVAIVDLEKASISDVRRLASEFPRCRLICTHRLADEKIWTAALDAGAIDVYQSGQTAAIVKAAMLKKAAFSAAA
jgi:DNA-binding NarL/FixJ family response regulator